MENSINKTSDASVAIYTRVSTQEQVVNGFSLDAQEKEGIRICQQNNWKYRTFVDKGKSADTEGLDHRQSLQEVMDLIEDHEIQYLFVTELDRLSRNPITLAYIKKILCENKVKVITPHQVFDFNDDEDDFITDLLGILAKRENRLRVKRVKRGKLEAAGLGKWVIGIRPYGWQAINDRDNKAKHNQLEPEPEESKIYLQMVEWSLQGLGSNTIARKLNALGIPTRCTLAYKHGKKYLWKSGTVHRILQNPLYKGVYNFDGISTKLPGIISEEKWELLQQNLRRNFNNATRNTKRFYLLQGLLYCKTCGRRLYGLIKPSRHMRCYCCISKRPDPEPRYCGLKNVNLDQINDFVWSAITKLIMNSKSLKDAINAQRAEHKADDLLLKTELGNIEKLIKQKDEQIETLLDAYGKSRTLTIDELDDKVGRVKLEKEELAQTRETIVQQLAKIELNKRVLLITEEYRELMAKSIKSFSDKEKFDFLHLVIDKILVDYDPSTNSHSIEIEGSIPIFDLEKLPLPSGQLYQRYV